MYQLFCMSGFCVILKMGCEKPSGESTRQSLSLSLLQVLMQMIPPF